MSHMYITKNQSFVKTRSSIHTSIMSVRSSKLSRTDMQIQSINIAFDSLLHTVELKDIVVVEMYRMSIVNLVFNLRSVERYFEVYLDHPITNKSATIEKVKEFIGRLNKCEVEKNETHKEVLRVISRIPEHSDILKRLENAIKIMESILEA